MYFKKLEEELENYFGAIAEREAGLSAEIPEMPAALYYTLQIERTGLPLFEGGLMDQPHIWLKEWKVCLDKKAVFDSIRELKNRTKAE